MGTRSHRRTAMLIAVVVLIFGQVYANSSSLSAVGNAASKPEGVHQQKPISQSIVEASVVYPQQISSARASNPGTFTVQQSLSVAQPSAVLSMAQQNGARSSYDNEPHVHTSVQTSASYSVQSQQHSAPEHPRSNPSSQQQQAHVTSNNVQPQTSVYLQPSHTVQATVQQQQQQLQKQQYVPQAVNPTARAQIRSDTYVVPARAHYSMAPSHQVRSPQHNLPGPPRQRAAYGPMAYHPHRPLQYRRPVRNWTANRRQQFEGPPGPPNFQGGQNIPPNFHLSVPRPPPPPPAAPAFSPPKFHSPPSFNAPPARPQHIIYTKPPPEEIYYGPNPPPLDYSATRHYPSKAVRPIISEPVPYSEPQEPSDHDIMNDLDMYIPDDEPPSRVSSSTSSSSPMGSMMMPMMLLGLTLPALGIVFTYLSRRRRRRRDTSPDTTTQEQLEHYTRILLKALEKSKKSA